MKRITLIIIILLVLVLIGLFVVRIEYSKDNKSNINNSIEDNASGVGRVIDNQEDINKKVKENDNNKNHSFNINNDTEFKILGFDDELTGNRIEFEFPEDDSFVVKGDGAIANIPSSIIENSEEEFSIFMGAKMINRSNYEDTRRFQEIQDENSEFEDFQVNGLRGYSYNRNVYSDEYSKEVIIILKEFKNQENDDANTSDMDNFYQLTLSIRRTNGDKEFDTLSFYESEIFQHILETIKIKENQEVSSFDGLMIPREKFGQKTIKAKDDSYIVNQTIDGEKIVLTYTPIEYKDEKFKEARIEIRHSRLAYSNSDDIHKILEEDFIHKSQNIPYEEIVINDIVLYCLNVEGTFSTGYFEYQGKLFEFDFFKKEEISKELGKQCMEDAINNLVVFDNSSNEE